MGQPGEQARIREVLIALGGSADDFDRAREPAATQANLESRIGAYSRLARPAETTPSGRARPAFPVVRRRRRPGLALARAARRLVRAPIALLHLVATLATRAGQAVRAFALLLAGVVVGAVRFVRATARAVVYTIAGAVRSFAGLALRTVVRTLATIGALALAVTGATGAVARSLRPHPRRRRRDDADVLSVPVVERVRAATGPPPPSAPKLVEPEPLEPEPFEPEPPAAAFAPAPASFGEVRAEPRGRKRRRAPVLALLAAAIAAASGATLVLVHGHGGGASQVNGAPAVSPPRVAPAPVPSRAAYTDPRAYAAALTRLALTTGQTELNGAPACGTNSTWNRWTCEAKGRPTVGAYAGHWLTYRCSPAYHPQPGGRPASLMINCKPVGPPSLTA